MRTPSLVPYLSSFIDFFHGFVEPNLVEAAAFCRPVGSGLTGTVKDMPVLPGRDQLATTVDRSVVMDNGSAGSPS